MPNGVLDWGCCDPGVPGAAAPPNREGAVEGAPNSAGGPPAGAAEVAPNEKPDDAGAGAGVVPVPAPVAPPNRPKPEAADVPAAAAGAANEPNGDAAAPDGAEVAAADGLPKPNADPDGAAGGAPAGAPGLSAFVGPGDLVERMALMGRPSAFSVGAAAAAAPLPPAAGANGLLVATGGVDPVGGVEKNELAPPAAGAPDAGAGIGKLTDGFGAVGAAVEGVGKLNVGLGASVLDALVALGAKLNTDLEPSVPPELGAGEGVGKKPPEAGLLG